MTKEKAIKNKRDKMKKEEKEKRNDSEGGKKKKRPRDICLLRK